MLYKTSTDSRYCLLCGRLNPYCIGSCSTRTWWKQRFKKCCTVSILIVLVDALQVDFRVNKEKHSFCLNPYCIGRCSTRITSWPLPLLVTCLNPYCVGRCSTRGLTLLNRHKTLRLNPYCIGRWYTSHYKDIDGEEAEGLNPYCVGRCSTSFFLGGQAYYVGSQSLLYW